MAKVQLAVVGAGLQGANHARVASGLRDAAVSVVVDSDPFRARTLAESIGAAHSTRIDSVIGEVDAAVVAVPAEQHCSVALSFIRSGTPVLVEKPLASTVHDADILVRAASEHEVILMVGHVERFNPAVLGLEKVLADPVHFDAIRASPFSARVDVDVALDMMIHDLDLVLALSKSEITSVQAVCRSIRSSKSDLACAIITFENGMTANVVANRVGQQKIRKLNVTQEHNFVTADLLRHDLTVSRIDHSEYLSSSGMAFRETGMVEIPFLEHRGEPLFLELQHFVESVLTGAPPRVSGLDGLRALQLALRVAEMGLEGGKDPNVQM